MLDGANYGYWKVRMIAFLKLMDNKCWKVVFIEWESPSTRDAADKIMLKPEITWTKEEDEESLENSRAMNALFNDLANESLTLGEKISEAKKVEKVLRSLPARHEYDQGNLQELRKLTGVSNVTNVKDMDISKKGRVTFGDGVKRNVVSKGNIDLPGAPRLKNVRLVERLSANLINIS
ncbi:gag-pol polyprotein [Cucumis melo var. makuwa]|uniref:Gag-pol polyprotein n=1 Tax=Cucumis melo var. makuwa TaxID=1194695 RepID=A0A5A7ULF0_CUCMM|nr:gag-pol polyprotein [Cucumis melo var. makuwa]